MPSGTAGHKTRHRSTDRNRRGRHKRSDNCFGLELSNCAADNPSTKLGKLNGAGAVCQAGSTARGGNGTSTGTSESSGAAAQVRRLLMAETSAVKVSSFNCMPSTCSNM